MDYESADSRSKDCWDPVTLLTPFLEKWTSETPTPDFVVDDVWCGMVAGIGFGASGTPETTDFWVQTLKQVYTGDEGRKKVRMALMCLLTRDGLLLRLKDVRCPVYWLQVSEPPSGINLPMGIASGWLMCCIPVGSGDGGFPLQDHGPRRTDPAVLR